MRQQNFLRKHWLILLILIGIFLLGIYFSFYQQPNIRCLPCPQYVTPSPEWYTNCEKEGGTVVPPEPDACGCLGPPRCVVQPADALTANDILLNPVNYDGKTVKVFGKVTELGKLKCPCFTLDNKPINIWYLYDNTNLYPTEIKDKINNGDYVTVTGKFIYDNTTGGGNIELEKIES